MCQLPIAKYHWGGGDFNLIRSTSEKSSGLGSAGLMTAFNNFIEKLQLRELYCDGGKYTWTNKTRGPYHELY